MTTQESLQIIRRLQYSPLRLGFACGTYTVDSSEPFIKIEHERGPYAGEIDRIYTMEEWTTSFEAKYFPKR
jgi:hypothetical protein